MDTGTSPRSNPAEKSQFLALVGLLLENAKWTLLTPLVISIAVAFLTLLLPNVYKATARVMPPQQSQSSTAMLLGQLGFAGPTAMLGQFGGGRAQSDLYVAVLKSRTIADELIVQFKLAEIYGEKLLVDARKELSDRTFVSASKEGIITIEVEDHEKDRAAALANAYVAELERTTSSLAITEAAQRRLFFEKHLEAAKRNMAKAEHALTKYKEAANLITLDGQASATLSASANLRAQITVKEVQNQALRVFATESNPELLRAQRELQSLKQELAKLENNARTSGGDILLPLGNLASAMQEYVDLVRDVKYFEVLFELMAKQYEGAKLDEARNAVLIQVLDKAVPPEKKSKPRRFVIFIICLIGMTLLFSVTVIVREAWKSAEKHPTHAEDILTIRDSLRWRPRSNRKKE